MFARSGCLRGMRLVAIVVSLLLPIIIFTSTRASWKSEGAPVCTAENDQFSLVTAPDVSGGMLFVWVDERSGDPTIYTQRIDRQGNVRWDENGVIVTTPNPGTEHPWISPDLSGGAWIVWCEKGYNPYGNIICKHNKSFT